MNFWPFKKKEKPPSNPWNIPEETLQAEDRKRHKVGDRVRLTQETYEEETNRPEPMYVAAYDDTDYDREAEHAKKYFHKAGTIVSVYKDNAPWVSQTGYIVSFGSEETETSFHHDQLINLSNKRRELELD